MMRYGFVIDKTAGFQTKRNPASEEGMKLDYYRLKMPGTQYASLRYLMDYVPPDIIFKIEFNTVIKITP